MNSIGTIRSNEDGDSIGDRLSDVGCGSFNRMSYSTELTPGATIVAKLLDDSNRPFDGIHAIGRGIEVEAGGYAVSRAIGKIPAGPRA